MKKIISVLLIFCLSSLTVFGQHDYFISGKLKMKSGTTLRFTKFNDYISLEKVRLATVKTDKDSCFSVNFKMNNQDIVNISVNELNLEALFYPDLHYNITLASTKNEHVGSLLITSCNQIVNPQFILNKTYNVFSDSTLGILFKQSNQRPPKTAVDLFNQNINKGLQQAADTFCKNLIQSRRLDYLMMSRAVNFPSAFNQFFDCKNLPLSNPAFASLLYSNFRLYFNLGPPQITKLNLFQGIPDSVHFSNLMQIMSVDPALICVPLREFVLMDNIYDMIKNGQITEARGILLLKEISLSVTHPYNKQVAEGLIKRLIRQQAGTTIPDFELLYQDGTIHSLSSFKGKPLHVTFFTLNGSANRTLLSQIADVEHFADSLGVSNFVCVTTDTDHEAVKKYWAENKYPMQLCFAPDDYEMIDYFNAYTLPCFVLLDSKGKINTLAPNFPGEQLLKQLVSLHQLDNPKSKEVKTQKTPQIQKDSQFLPGSPHIVPPQSPSKK